MVKKKNTDTSEEKILAAARKVFLEKGMAGARMQDIADEAGINKALLHYYFRSKDKLFETIFAETSSRFIPRLNQILDSDLPLIEKINMFCEAYISQMQQNPYIVLFIMNEANKHPESFLHRMWGGEKKPHIKKLVKQIEAEMKQGNIKKVNPMHLLINMMSLCAFPFIAKPIWQYLYEMDNKQFVEFIEQRKKEVPKFILESIKK
jgi:TetR/AcrR family transcriptional regulator